MTREGSVAQAPAVAAPGAQELKPDSGVRAQKLRCTGLVACGTFPDHISNRCPLPAGRSSPAIREVPDRISNK